MSIVIFGTLAGPQYHFAKSASALFRSIQLWLYVSFIDQSYVGKVAAGLYRSFLFIYIFCIFHRLEFSNKEVGRMSLSNHVKTNKQKTNYKIFHTAPSVKSACDTPIKSIKANSDSR